MTDAGAPAAGGPDVGAVLAEAHRREWALVLTAAVRLTGDLDRAEECAQEAFAAAWVHWPLDGVPDNPGAWLTTVARRKALDSLRRDSTLRAKLPLLVPLMVIEDEGSGALVNSEDGVGDGSPLGDDRLRLVFTCCHPALAREAQVALTLRLICGVDTAAIARAFLVSESTMAARVTRAKKKIAAARIPYRVPAAHELPERLDAVLTVVHLLFTTGHTTPRGERLVRGDLIDRALGLARLLHELMPDEREVTGLLALMLLHEARRSTRSDETGQLVLLAEQDRSQWDMDGIRRGRELVFAALRGGRPGRFALQAAIAAVHCDAPTYETTDWNEIVGLYDLLLLAWPSPVVGLNRAAALSMRDGPAAGLAAIELLDTGALAGYHYLAAVRADLLRQLGRRDEAAAEYRTALVGTDNAAEQDFLRRRLAELADLPSAGG